MKDDHLNNLTQEMTHSSLVLCEKVRILLKIDEFNDIDVMFFDIGNGYLNAYTNKKLYFISGN